jgi:hypothetical protein
VTWKRDFRQPALYSFRGYDDIVLAVHPHFLRIRSDFQSGPGPFTAVARASYPLAAPPPVTRCSWCSGPSRRCFWKPEVRRWASA